MRRNSFTCALVKGRDLVIEWRSLSGDYDRGQLRVGTVVEFDE